MTSQQISKIVEYRAFNDNPLIVELKETHISWIILTENYAFKIKKPVKYSFLDFSTLEKRKYYCSQEVILNQRLAEDTYLGVVPIRLNRAVPFIDGKNGIILGYAVKMKRLDNTREMDVLLQEGKVHQRHLFQLADQLSTFHAFTDEAEETPNIEKMQADFADITVVEAFIRQEIGKSAGENITAAMEFSQQFLKAHIKDIRERHIMGFTIDGHGDLHSGNIFLLDQPIIFDCIEFNPHFRQMDVLSELAFLCMDLDFYGREDLAIYFIQRYNINYPVIINDADRRLFLYFKLYRANIRMKVHALRAKQAIDDNTRKKHLGLTEDYYHLFKNYFTLLQKKQKELFKRNGASRTKTS